MPVLFLRSQKPLTIRFFYLSFASNSVFLFIFCLEFGVDYVVFALSFNYTFGRRFVIRFYLLLRIRRRLHPHRLFF